MVVRVSHVCDGKSVVLHLYIVYHVNSPNCLVFYAQFQPMPFVISANFGESVYLALKNWMKTHVTLLWKLNCEGKYIVYENKLLCRPIFSGCVQYYSIKVLLDRCSQRKFNTISIQEKP